MLCDRADLARVDWRGTRLRRLETEGSACNLAPVFAAGSLRLCCDSYCLLQKPETYVCEIISILVLRGERQPKGVMRIKPLPSCICVFKWHARFASA